jgi:UDP-glucose 4-epimerase
MKKQRIAITGGAGLIGSFLAEELLKLNHQVVIIDDFSKGSIENLEGFSNAIDIREGDLEDSEFAIDSISDCDTVYHLASRAYGVGYSIDHHLEALLHNERITNNMLSAIIKHKPKHLLMASSSCVYDDNGPNMIPELPLFLNDPENVNKGYGWAKRFLEKKSEILAEQLNIPIVIVRPFNIYGERYQWAGQYSSAIPMLVKRVMDGENPMTVWGSGDQRRSYIHAQDCARMMIALVDCQYTKSPVNIGTEETISIKELVQMICKGANLDPELVFDLEKPEGRFIKSSDTTLFNRIVSDFSFEVSLEEGIFRMIQWYSKNF